MESGAEKVVSCCVESEVVWGGMITGGASPACWWESDEVGKTGAIMPLVVG
jgi:hypothetical protein